jgi:hypothetical protein
MSSRFVSEFLLQTFSIIIFFLFVGFFAIYIFNRELLDMITESARVYPPLLLLFIIYILTTLGKAKKIREKRLDKIEDAEGESSYYDYKEIYVKDIDEMKNDLVAIVTAMLIIVIAWVYKGKFDFPDVLQAVLAFTAVYVTKDIYFKKGIFGIGGKHFEDLD